MRVKEQQQGTECGGWAECCLTTQRPLRGGGGGSDTNSAWRNRAPGPHRNTARQAMDGLWTEVCGQQTQSNGPGNNQHNPQYANYWAPLTRKRHIPPHPAQPQHTNHWAPRTRKRHRQEHRPQRPTERSDPTQHAKGRAGDCPGPPVKKQQPDGLSHGGSNTPPPLGPGFHRRKQCTFTKGNIDLGCFWYTTFWLFGFQTPPPPRLKHNSEDG